MDAFCRNVEFTTFPGGLSLEEICYLWEGFHGCVNVPYDKAAEIYANIEVGMPVICV